MLHPFCLCMSHLSGEHGEIHKHRHNFVKRHSIAGRIEGNACEPAAMKLRHDSLEAELRRRAVKAGRKPPCSPFEMPDISHLPVEHRLFKVDRIASANLLRERCPECAERMTWLYWECERCGQIQPCHPGTTPEEMGECRKQVKTGNKVPGRFGPSGWKPMVDEYGQCGGLFVMKIREPESKSVAA